MKRPTATKTAATDTAPAPALDTRVATTIGQFEFVITKGLPIPEALSRAMSARALPFKESFTQMAINEELFVPNSFWTASTEIGGRGVDPAKATSGYIRAKIRGAFNEMVKDGKMADDKELVVFPRKKGDPRGVEGTETYPDDGFSCFVVAKGH